MHHSYTPRGLDENKNSNYFSLQSEPSFPNASLPSSGRCATRLTTDCKLLEKDHSLHFALLRLHLVELIRTCGTKSTDDCTPALDFATAELAPRAPANPEFLEDLERTMTLLIIERKDLPPYLAALLEPKLRKDVAQRVNEALLKEQGERTKAKLFGLVHLRAWSEQKAREAKKDLPDHMGFGLDQHGKSQDGGINSNGETEAMVA
ncbi:MAG: hypothetical protein L6R40_004181 [Gallowayella cf. fulva]|nr:MAG: hypothetical protein L6R40_004181 [Xanthomendoza cf. fulva]